MITTVLSSFCGIYRAYTKEWCGIKSDSHFITPPWFVVAQVSGQYGDYEN
jgi:hypothetical protein